MTHAAETLLALLRDGTLALDVEIAGALLRSTDAVREMLTVIEQTAGEGENVHAALVADLGRLAHERNRETPLGEMLIERGVVTPVEVAIGLVQQAALDDPRPIGEILVESGAAEPQDVAAALQDQQRARSGDSTLRVDVGLLDALVTLVGELVLTRNQIRQLTSGAEMGNNALATAAQRLNGVTTELQSHVMKTRMQPIGSVWSKLPRVVRDLSVQCDKRVRVEMSGEETELDKAIVEAIKDPLTHMVRNSVDHGIERPVDRIAAGKPEEGLLRLRAYHESGSVRIDISDDGRGIDVAKLKAKALEQRLLTEDQAQRMNDREALDLLFRPGLSTADQVSNLSGRGVGMDVVRTNIESIGGTVECDSRAGEGTTFNIRIPLTLAIVPALIARCGNERFAVPHANLVELVGLGNDADQAIESVNGAPVYRLRGRMLPIVYLNEQLRLRGDRENTDRGTVIVLRTDGRQEFGLVVDRVIDTEEIVVKPLPADFDTVRAFSGCTVMGDGEIALILDVRGIAEMAGVSSDGSPDAAVDARASDGEDNAPVSALLIVRIGDGAQAAIALEHIERIEEFDRSAIEHAAGHPVVQYRNALLPLLDLASVIGLRGAPDDSAEISVVVYADGGRTVGLVIHRVLDIVEDHLRAFEVPERVGVTGSTIVRGVVTDLLDIATLVDSMPSSFGELVVPAGNKESIDA